MRVRPWLLVVFGISILALFGVGGWFVWDARHQKVIALQKADLATRDLRATPLLEVAPAPLPIGKPLLGSKGVHADGYPNEYVDEPAIRSLLWHRKYAELTRVFEEFQSDFEADPRKEYWLTDAADAFGSPEPSLAKKLDEWVAATPDSFAPYLARGDYDIAVAWAKRGGAWASETSQADMAASFDPMARASTDLARALAIKPKCIAAMRRQIPMYVHLGDVASRDAVLTHATTVCPECFLVRVVFLVMTTPRWGGTYTAMRAFARTAPVTRNPRLRLLDGFADMDEANRARDQKDFARASVAIERAIALGDQWDFLVERARLREDTKDFAGAQADIDKANELRPGHPEILFQRAWLLDQSRHEEEAARALLDGLRVAPTDEAARAYYPNIVNNLQYEAQELDKKGEREAALRRFDLAVDLAPTDQNAIRRRAMVIVGKGHPDIAALEEAAKSRPDDFRLHQQLDYLLAQKREYPRIIAMWTDYLARNPDDGAAYRERGGAYHNSGKHREALDDVTKVCELGDNEGCVHMKGLGEAPK